MADTVTDIQTIIEETYEQRSNITTNTVNHRVKEAVLEAINGIDSGVLRIAEKKNGSWTVNDWLKKAVLLYFRIEDSRLIPGAYTSYFDKISAKFEKYKESDLRDSGIRVVPPSTVRYGAYIAPSVILMPSFVNIGAYVDSGTMIDTWATVGSCAQIGKNVHISGGAGIGGVLEPVQASPTIIEDNCFIGARSEIAEGVIIEEGSVISMGVYLGQSTKIYNRATGEITYGKVPRGSVVVAGNLPAKNGDYSLYCAVIVKQVDDKTRSKTSLNELLRDT